jgi:hypothetical protein
MQNSTFIRLYLNNIQNNIATRNLTINTNIELDITPDVKSDIIEPGEKVKTFSSAKLSEKSKDFLDNEPPQAKLEELPCTALLCNEPNIINTKELTHINDTTDYIIEIPSIILQNHINYNFYNLENQTDLLQEHSDEIFYYLKTIDNETILYKRYEHNDIPAELKDLNPLVHDNVASYSVSGIYYFNKCNEKGYLLNLNYINKLWHINGLSIIQKENEINLCINNGIYYILKTINNFESYLVKVELIKQLPNMNNHIYKSKNKLYGIDINGTVTQIIKPV